jgi:hypothetical protein
MLHHVVVAREAKRNGVLLQLLSPFADQRFVVAANLTFTEDRKMVDDRLCRKPWLLAKHCSVAAA